MSDNPCYLQRSPPPPHPGQKQVAELRKNKTLKTF
jgi:hypothetical protein